MSFVITIFVREGIVMTSDSRLTLNSTIKEDEHQIVKMSVGLSDSNYKTFLAPNNIGISNCGAADIKGVPIAGYIESFIEEKIANREIDVDEVPDELLNYFRQFDPIPNTKFIVAGYKKENNQIQQQIWITDIIENNFETINPKGRQGAYWSGVSDILQRLIGNVAILNNDKEIVQVLPRFNIPWEFFTLQDAIDFCIFATRTTIDAIHFQPRPKTVGGPIDILVIKPGEAFWGTTTLNRGRPKSGQVHPFLHVNRQQSGGTEAHRRCESFPSGAILINHG
jgi:hypothetical protein